MRPVVDAVVKSWRKFVLAGLVHLLFNLKLNIVYMGHIFHAKVANPTWVLPTSKPAVKENTALDDFADGNLQTYWYKHSEGIHLPPPRSLEHGRLDWSSGSHA